MPQSPAQPEEATEAAAATESDSETERVQTRLGRSGWARMLKRVIDIDTQRGPDCGGGELGIMTAILERSMI